MNPAQPANRTGGNDAVAFTSGYQGAPFSAGVVHAWLAADREAPLVATGISMGTVAAAAMRRAYQELEHQDCEDLEVKRWRWFQRYFLAVTDNPLGPLWNAVPDPVDFYAETPPAKDPSVPDDLKQESEDARRHFYLLVKCGLWLAKLPIRISTIGTIAVMYVRRKERYGFPLQTWFSFYWSSISALASLNFHLIRSPQWIIERSFAATPRRRKLRPMVGWVIYLCALLLPLLLPLLLAGLPVGVFRVLHSSLKLSGRASALIVFAAIAVGLFGLDRVIFPAESNTNAFPSKRFSRLSSGFQYFFENLDITKGLLHPYEIRRSLHDLFVKDAPDFVVNGPSPDSVKAVFVCAALEETEQIVLHEKMPVVEALTAALAIPGVLPPQTVDAEWIATKTDSGAKKFNVIDGAAVRTNPLPAFFDWCKKIEPELAAKIERGRDGSDLKITSSLHVVYSVPTGYDGSAQDAPGMECPDIVLSLQTALQLGQRRDTRQEVRQTNYLSCLEDIRRRVSGGRQALVILADDIAPRLQIDLGNPLSPDHDKLRRGVADGCRATLETLYIKEIQDLSYGLTEIHCFTLLEKIAPRRGANLACREGFEAVCENCTRMLKYRPAPKHDTTQEGVRHTYGERSLPPAGQLTKLFPQLATNGSKVVFLGSGGVFRGAFHIGVIAAMYETRLLPDLVVGASVGTLMGGALCRMTAGAASEAPKVLSDLTNLFVNVDKKVSLTFTLKNAAKQLGTRARGIRLSPEEISRKVRSGSKSDAGYAATGAPPVVTDALSSLFVIPHQSTVAVASQFVSGHFSEAVAQFLLEVRRETLSSFGIRTAVMGASLLETQARQLLAFSRSGTELSLVQPYQNNTPSGRAVAFFGTTSLLNTGTSMLLGRDFLTTSSTWNATQAGLCSSAFPAVFSARPESYLMPGAGRTDRYFADGGLFDNLPFFPAIEVLSAVQHDMPFANREALQQRLKERAANPNLIVSAGLNPAAVANRNVKSDTMFAVYDRATSLSYQSKTRIFDSAAKKTLGMLDEISRGSLENLTLPQLEFLNAYVPAEVVNITPTDADHINPTFAFCQSLGMKASRVQRSIADGCYRSLRQFASNDQVKRKLAAHDKAVDWLSPGPMPKSSCETVCPYFLIGKDTFQCPFTRDGEPNVRPVFEICKCDPMHS